MDKFLITSDFLKAEKVRKTMKSIAYLLAQHYDVGLATDVIKAIILGLDGGPEKFEHDAIYIIKELNTYNTTTVLKREILRQNIQTLIEEADGGWVSYSQLDKELAIIGPKDMNYRRQVIYKLIKEGIIEKHPTQDGLIRKVIQDVDEINWQDADISKITKIRWPFVLENQVNIYPRNLIVIAGSPNAGKTAFLLNFIELNMKHYPIHYFSSEMGPEELKLRISKFDIPMDQWEFKSYERATDFARVIRPDDINIIDYLEIGDNFFTITDEFRKIFDNLGKGIAIVALQKKFGATMGRGAEFGMEKPRLYLTMDSGELIIQKAKNWATKDNPNKIKIRFKLIDGAKFIQTGRENNVPF